MRKNLGWVPQGYSVHRAGSTWLVFDESLSSDLVRLRLAEPAVLQTLFSQASRRGRGTTPVVTVNSDTQALLRRYRHGGLLRNLTGTLFVGPGRALRELHVTRSAELAGAPVPHVLCLVAHPVLGPLWSALIGTRLESQAHDLLEGLLEASQRDKRMQLVREVGDAVRNLHDAGVEHRDLQLRNVLISRTNPRRIIVVDLDRARFHPQGTLPIRARARNLGRLFRSATKEGLFGPRLGRREVALFLAAYTAGDRDLRRRLRAYVVWEHTKLQAHQLTYPLRRVKPAAELSPRTPR